MVDGGILLRVQCLTDDTLSMGDLMRKGGLWTVELEGADVYCSLHQANINKIFLSSKEGIQHRCAPQHNKPFLPPPVVLMARI